KAEETPYHAQPPPRLQIGEAREDSGVTPRSTGNISQHDDLSSANSTTSSEQRNGPYVFAHHGAHEAISPLSCGGDWAQQQSPQTSSPNKKSLLGIQKSRSNSTHNRSVPSALLGVAFDSPEEEIVFEHDPKSLNGDSYSDEPLFFHHITVENQSVVDRQTPGVFNFDSNDVQRHLSIDKSGSSNAEDILKMISANNFERSTQEVEGMDQYEEGSSTTSWKSRLRNNFLRRAPYKSMGDKYVGNDEETEGVEADAYNEGQPNHVASHEMEMPDHVDPPKRHRAAMHICCWVLIIAMVLGVGATGIYFLVKRDDDMSIEPSTDKTIPWSPSYSMRQEQFRAVLGSLSGFNELNDFSTPQYQALHWMANEDELGLDPATSEYAVIIERYVAALVYFSTNGKQWTNQFNFLSSVSICEWNDNVVIDGPAPNTVKRGILCNDRGRVQTIDLQRNNVSGPLNWEIASLESLRSIRMQHNQLSQSLPSQLGLLSMLRFLDLNNNAITGSIPSNFGYMKQLKYLKLNRNRIDGTIPLLLGQMPKLTLLHLSNNELRGGLLS
ncbi:MAG: hypothetical protein SGILL_009061, partial [Bacillariaceae sp.]